MTDIILTPEELFALTGYKRPNDQLGVLLRRGFTRACVQRGRLVLERAHYEAVCAGRAAIAEVRPRPKITLPPSLLEGVRQKP